MNIFRTLLLVVCSLVSAWASAQGVQTFTILPATGYSGTPYQVKFIRPTSDYALDVNGLSDVKKAVISGTFTLTVVSSGSYAGSTYTPQTYYQSCVIAKGTRPGTNPPSCQTTTVITPPTTTTSVITIPAFSQVLAAIDAAGTGDNIGSGYFGPYGDNTQYRVHSLTAPVTASNYNLAIHYQTNTQATGKANIVVNGTSNIEFDLEGAEGGKRTVNRTIALNSGTNSIRLEGKSGTVFFYDNIAVTRAQSTSVVTGSGGSTNNSGTTNPTTTTPTMPAGTFAAGYGEGNLGDLMQYAPFVPSAATDQLSSWNIANVRQQFISNGTVKLGIHGIIGGAVTHLSVNGGKNWINTDADGSNGTYVYNGQTITGLAGPGRSALSMSMYGYPRSNYTKPGIGTTAEYYDTGRNPVPGGSVYKNYSGLLGFEKRTLSDGRMAMYAKTNPYIWALRNYRSNVTTHSFFTFGSNPRVIEYFFIVENGSDDQTALEYLGAEQEGPFMFLTADLWHHWIWQGSGALTANGLREVSPAQPKEEANPNTNATFGGSWQGTRAFIGGTDDSGNGVWLVPRYNNRFNTRRILANGGDSTSTATSYIQSAVMMNFDTKGNHAFSGQVFLGNKQQFVDWYNAENPQTLPFSWSFTPGKTMGWWGADTPAKFNSDNRYEWTIGKSDGSGGNFCPPYGVYPAADMPVIYLKGKFFNISQIDIRWNRFDQDDNASNAAGQVTTVSVNGDGSEQTIAIPMQGKPGWNSVISSMRFAPHLGNTSSTNQRFIPTYIGKNNPATN